MTDELYAAVLKLRFAGWMVYRDGDLHSIRPPGARHEVVGVTNDGLLRTARGHVDAG